MVFHGCPVLQMEQSELKMNMERIDKWTLSIHRKSAPVSHFAHHKSHMTWPGIEPVRGDGKPATATTV
jgi:hypothetical protein